MQRLLDYQADRIEQVLSAHRVPCRVLGGVVTSRWVRFEVVPSLGARVSNVARLSEEIALWLGSGGVRIQRQGGCLHIEVPREESDPVRLLPLMARLREIPRQTAVLGLDDGGMPLLLRLSSPEVCHVLVAGTTGSGKTALVRSMVVSLALRNRPSEVQMVVVDPKGRGYGALEGLPHLLRPVVRETGQAVAMLDEMVDHMMRRDREGVQDPRLVVVIDEMADLVLTGGAGVVQSITRLTQRGREAGIHVIGCTQKPTVEAIGSLVKSNFPVRLVGSVASPEDGRVASGLRAAGAERLMGRGDFLLVLKGELVRFQAAYASPEEVGAAVRMMRRGNRIGEHRPDTQTTRPGDDGAALRRARCGALGGPCASAVADVARQLRLVKR